MEIVRLEAENVKRLKAVKITPQGKVVVIGGRNAQGKSSVLDSIQYALGGKGCVPARPVRDGEESAQVVVELDDLIVKRTFGADGKSSLKVTTKDGAAYNTPQTILDKLVGELSFDPLAFSRMEPRAQLATLRRLTGVSTDELDARYRKVYDERTIVNREIKTREGQLQGPAPEQPKEPVVDTQSLVAVQRNAQGEHNSARERCDQHKQMLRLIESDKRDLERHEHQRREWTEEIERLQALIKQSNTDSTELNHNILAAVQRADAFAAETAELAKKLPDLDAIAQRLASAGTINAAHEAYQRHLEKKKDLEKARKESERLTKQLDSIAAEKAAVIAAAPFPVPGLGFGEGGVTYNGVPFEQASSAEQLRVSVAMGLAMNPTLKVLLIRDGSLLDESNLEVLGQMAEQAGAQIWIERVGEDKEASVIIEDGQVKD